MSVAEAAAYLALSEETVRRWFDAADQAGTPVGERDRDEHGQPIPGRHRKPYRDAVEAYAARRRPDTATS